MLNFEFYCISETNIMLYDNYISIRKKKVEKSRPKLLGLLIYYHTNRDSIEGKRPVLVAGAVNVHIPAGPSALI